MNNYSEPYNSGFAACESGEARADNPYATGTWESDEWTCGWDAVSQLANSECDYDEGYDIWQRRYERTD